MFRVVLAAYYLLLALAGPTPCCCSLSRVMTTASAWAGVETSSSDFSCCEPGIEWAAEEGDNGESSDEPTPSRPRCGCELKMLCSAPSQVEVSSVEDTRLWMEACLWLSALTVRPPIVEADPLDAFRDEVPRSKSGRDLRIALRSWRC